MESDEGRNIGGNDATILHACAHTWRGVVLTDSSVQQYIKSENDGRDSRYWSEELNQVTLL